MGRKIPAKKHRGVKDPLVQQAKRLASLKGKINAPPKDPDEQPVPKSLTRLFAFQDSSNRKSITKKKNVTLRHHTHNTTVPAAPHNPVARLRQLAGESARGFSLRINSALRALHSPAEELHYPLDLEAEDEKGMRMSEQRERRARKRRRAARAVQAGQPGQPGQADQPGQGGGAEPRLTRTQKLALKKKAKKMKASEQASGARREVQYERVSFGDVAHAPPALHFKHGAPRARSALLLAPLLAPAPGAADRERARLDAVAAYRALKADKRRN